MRLSFFCAFAPPLSRTQKIPLSISTLFFHLFYHAVYETRHWSRRKCGEQIRYKHENCFRRFGISDVSSSCNPIKVKSKMISLEMTLIFHKSIASFRMTSAYSIPDSDDFFSTLVPSSRTPLRNQRKELNLKKSKLHNPNLYLFVLQESYRNKRKCTIN